MYDSFHLAIESIMQGFIKKKKITKTNLVDPFFCTNTKKQKKKIKNKYRLIDSPVYVIRYIHIYYIHNVMLFMIVIRKSCGKLIVINMFSYSAVMFRAWT